MANMQYVRDSATNLIANALKLNEYERAILKGERLFKHDDIDSTNLVFRLWASGFELIPRETWCSRHVYVAGIQSIESDYRTWDNC